MAWVVSAVVAAFEVGATAATIMTAVTEVGMSLSVVGAVTGNKDLMKIGGVLGIAGGIGGMAAGGVFGEAAQGAMESTFGSGATAATTEGLAQGALADGSQQAATEGLANQAAENAAAGTLSNTASGLGDIGLSQAGDGLNLSQFAGDTAGSALNTPSAITAAPGGAVDAAGSISTPTTMPGSVAPVATGEVAPVTVDTGAIHATYGEGGLDGGPLNGLTATGDTFAKAQSSGLLASAQQWLTGLHPTVKAEILKAALAVPGGIQAQMNKAQELALQQQRVNQTSYGSVPNYFGAGIIANAQKKGG